MEGTPIKEKILQFLARHQNEEFKLATLAHRLSITDSAELHQLQNSLRELAAAGQVRRARQKRYGYATPPSGSRLTGVLRLERTGGGTVELSAPASGEVTIPSKFLGTALDGDIVSVVPFGRDLPAVPRFDKPVEGEIVDIVARNPRPIVGTFEKGKHFFFVVPDNLRIGRDIYIPQGKTHGARPGQKVVARLETWESRNLNPEGSVTEVLGKSGEVSAEMKSVVREFSLPESFPKEVLAAAEEIPSVTPPAEIARRRDLRSIPCFTIDPEDAKDFDDALSIERSGDHWRLGVHIADVGHFVREGSVLDREALRRGTSVYLANEVIPMLPEKLSNDLCSLRPDEDRLAYSVLIEITDQGKVLSSETVKTVIRSKKRFSYEQAQQILEKGSGLFHRELEALRSIARILYAQRVKGGSLDFDSPEVKFRFNDEGAPVEIIKKDRLDAHRLVEECMLLANRLVARAVGVARQGDQSKPFIYRIHDAPPPEKMDNLARFLEHLGYRLNISSGLTVRSLQKLLEQVKGKEEETVVNEVMIRSMAKAVYSEQNIGHYGLGFDFYTHFTSPIRRYPDLLVHRLTEEYAGNMTFQRRKHFAEAIPEICASSTEREKVAQSAERASTRVMQVEYMKRHLGDEFDAIISGVVKFGLFVEINDLLVEGFIHVRELEDDYYTFDERAYALMGMRNKRRYRLGDRVRVQVMRVDPEEREIQFRLLGEETTAGTKKAGPEQRQGKPRRQNDGRPSRRRKRRS